MTLLHNAETPRSFASDPELTPMLKSPEEDIKTFIPSVFRDFKQLIVHTHTGNILKRPALT